MSKDFTPKQLLACEAILGDLLESMRSMTVTVDGVTSHVYSEEELAHRKQLPILGKLLNCDAFNTIYASAASIPGGLDLLSDRDKKLQVYIATGKGDRESETIRWFEGTLDKNFYYGERNEELFIEKLQTDLSRLKPSLSDKIQAAEMQKEKHTAIEAGCLKQPERG